MESEGEVRGYSNHLGEKLVASARLGVVEKKQHFRLHFISKVNKIC